MIFVGVEAQVMPLVTVVVPQRIVGGVIALPAVPVEGTLPMQVSVEELLAPVVPPLLLREALLLPPPEVHGTSTYQ